MLSFLNRILFRKPTKPAEPFYMADNPAYAQYVIGRFTYGKPRVSRWDDRTRLSIGSFCSIAGDVTILLGGEHRTDWVTTYPFSVIFPEGMTFEGHPATKGDVIIGNDVWIGQGAMILSGVNIGNGAVIAARSVVTKSVNPYAIVAGNPARELRKRFTESQIQSLESIAWWDWQIEKIIEAFPLLLDDDMDTFINRYQIPANPE